MLVASNLHGDILSDLTGALAESLGMAPSANLQLAGTYPSMFEPVHGSAFDIVGKGIANPVGAVLSAAMMLDELGGERIASVIRDGVEAACARGVLDAGRGRHGPELRSRGRDHRGNRPPSVDDGRGGRHDRGLYERS